MKITVKEMYEIVKEMHRKTMEYSYEWKKLDECLTNSEIIREENDEKIVSNIEETLNKCIKLLECVIRERYE